MDRTVQAGEMKLKVWGGVNGWKRIAIRSVGIKRLAVEAWCDAAVVVLLKM